MFDIPIFDISIWDPWDPGWVAGGSRAPPRRPSHGCNGNGNGHGNGGNGNDGNSGNEHPGANHPT